VTDDEQDEQFYRDTESIAFPKLNDHQLSLLQPLGERRVMKRGDVVFKAGQRDLGLTIVLRGEIEAFETRDGTEQILATAEERDFFQTSSSADRFRKGRTMVLLAFCPGGGSAVPSPRTAKNIELGFKHATVSDLGPQDQWVFDSASDKQIKFDALAGELKRGGKLTGKVTGAIAGKKPPFTWDLQFDLVLPQRAAGAGPSC